MEQKIRDEVVGKFEQRLMWEEVMITLEGLGENDR